MSTPRTKILLAEDDENLGSLLKEYLQIKDYEAQWLTDGEKAYRSFEKNKYDICILDIMMPDIKGYEVCKKIKSNEETKSIKIIVLSAYLDEEKFQKMKECGADVCFSKPLPLPQLKEEVARLIQTR